LISGALGAVGGGGVAKGLAAKARRTPIKKTGKIGDALSIAENKLRGNTLLETQTRSIPGHSTVVDSTWRNARREIYYVESKFGNSALTPAQRIARDNLGDAYHVERWGYDFVERVGAYVGGAGTSIARSGQDPDCTCIAP